MIHALGRKIAMARASNQRRSWDRKPSRNPASEFLNHLSIEATSALVTF